jgi:hypothetical protein
MISGSPTPKKRQRKRNQKDEYKERNCWTAYCGCFIATTRTTDAYKDEIFLLVIISFHVILTTMFLSGYIVHMPTVFLLLSMMGARFFVEYCSG